MILRRLSLACAAFAAAFLSLSCGPLFYGLEVQMRYPSPSGLDPAGKSISVVSFDGSGLQDTLFSNSVVEGLAQGLEAMYFDSNKAVELYKISGKDYGDYSVKDSLVNLVMATGTDIVMLVGRPSFGNVLNGKVQASSMLYIYDSMDRRDTVLSSIVSGRVTADLGEDSLFRPDAMYLGYGASRQFQVRWAPEEYTIVYFDVAGEPQWEKANYAVEEMDWALAAKYWTEIARTTGNNCRLSCAAYDLAIACLMQGDLPLALEWLDLSDEVYPVSQSPSLRKRILSRM